MTSKGMSINMAYVNFDKASTVVLLATPTAPKPPTYKLHSITVGAVLATLGGGMPTVALIVLKTVQPNEVRPWWVWAAIMVPLGAAEVSVLFAFALAPASVTVVMFGMSHVLSSTLYRQILKHRLGWLGGSATALCTLAAIAMLISAWRTPDCTDCTAQPASKDRLCELFKSRVSIALMSILAVIAIANAGVTRKFFDCVEHFSVLGASIWASFAGTSRRPTPPAYRCRSQFLLAVPV